MEDETPLGERHCSPAREGSPGLDEDAAAALNGRVPEWTRQTREGVDRLERTFRFHDFMASMDFVNRVADLAEAQQHHPDLHIHYDRVTVELWTHTVRGLHVNDFIMAARIDGVQRA